MAGIQTKKRSRRRFVDRLRTQGLVIVPAFLLVIAAFVFAYQFVGPAPPSRIVFATGHESGAYHAFGKKYAERFRAEGIELVLKQSAGSTQNLALLSDPESGIVGAFLQGGIGVPKDNPDLRSLGSIYYEPLWVFVRGTAGISRLTELAGKRVAVGAVGSGTRAVARALLAENGIDGKSAVLVDKGGPDAAGMLTSGAVDAAIFVTSVTSKTVRGLLATPGVHLTSFERADAYLRRHRYLSRVILPKGAVDLAKNLPNRDMVLLAPTATVVVSSKIHPALVDLLLLIMRDAHRDGGLLEAPGAFPTARYVTFPPDPAARRFHERGPPFLQRYLPFWVANLLDRLKILLLPLVTILYPLFKLLPPAYSWSMRSKVNRGYKELQAVDDAVHGGTTSPQDALVELERIERAVEEVSVPAGHAARVYNLRLHIDYLKRRLKAPRDEA
jgi:TRAP transporter TAXI family solute receptor